METIRRTQRLASDTGSLPEPIMVGAQSFFEIPALYQQALAIHRQNRLSEAETLYRQILEVNPNHPGTLHFLGMVAFTQKNLEEAELLIARSLELCDTKPVYFNNYGVVLNERKRHKEAKNAFEKALTLKPNYPDALSNLGLATVLLNEPTHVSEHYFRAALRLQPGHRDAILHLIGLFLKNERGAEAVPFVEHQLAMEPENAELLHQLGTLYGENGDVEKAKWHFQRAASLPGGKPVWKWKHLWYCPTFFENEEDIEKYWAGLNADLDAAIAEKPLYNWRTLVHDGFTHSFNLPHLNRCCKEVLEKFARLFEPSFPFERPTYKPGEKIRVGFLVTPGHEGGFLRLTNGLIEGLDSEKFVPILIYNETTAPKYEGRFQRPDLVHVPYSWNFEDAVRTIHSAKCDVIYYWKVGADVWNTFLPMCRLAPVQVTSWSTHGTSGMSEIDYYVSWDKAEIPEAAEHYNEKLFLLKTTPLYEPILTDLPQDATRSELDLPETGAIYFCPHRPAKYHPIFDESLKGLLERDTTGHVVLFLGKPSPLTEMFVARMRKNLGETNFKRTLIRPQQTVRDYYRYLSVATVLLQSPIYSGEITAVDGFLYGVPSVSLTGELLPQRYVTAFYKEFEIDGPAASCQEEYVAQAVKLGTDPEYRQQISEKILAQRNTFFENKKTIHEWERFLLEAVSPKHPVATLSEARTSDQPVPMGNIDINVSYGCNLNCQYCTHFCPQISGLVPLEEIIDTFRTWHRKIAPDRLLFVGGEPLLHPYFETILQEARSYWPNARLDILTNGLLLPKKREILSLLKKENSHVYVSQHFEDEKYLHDFEESLQYLRESGVPFSISSSHRDWRKYYELNTKGLPIPFDSSPEKAWSNCCTKNGCPSLLENRLYKCAHLAYATLGYRRGVIPDSWKVVESYQPLQPDCDSGEILSHLASEAIPECRICPEKYEFVPLEQKRFAHHARDSVGCSAS